MDYSTTVGQSNQGARDLGVLNVDTNERKPANRFARRRKKALPQLSIHSLYSLAPLAKPPSRNPGAPPGQERQDPLPDTTPARFHSIGAHSPTD